MNYAIVSLVLILCMSKFMHASDHPDQRLTRQTIVSIVYQAGKTNTQKVAQIKVLIGQERVSRDSCPSPFSSSYSEEDCSLIIARLKDYLDHKAS